ncbi:hypothetical protein ASPVEDRAFT_47078 [Aspergillus versicolor CBS 583.65]|uniref:Uncharacterized protein n=1 Tax=Aspergillus versicolor CBS 583.65 TaxID=1036611 RepID=A0A1L9Q280_ASPVE|nr:uncharacterized protein ASPVEDRAFT_47078 [Aspergillus versicolor CBS 583.65]OJJ07887.1 hypothetical protein ASPVEDRAFT_47078 [Aspergillus versicolor CBS 583.65]
MSSTTTTAASTCTGSAMYELPIKDAACGTPNNKDKDYKSLFSDCAAPAAVRTYHDDCALYAPALDQSIQSLTDCLYDAGVKWEDVWCSGNTSASATGTAYPTATATSKEESSSTSTSKGSEETDGKETDADTNGATSGRLGLSGAVVWGLFGLQAVGAGMMMF